MPAVVGSVVVVSVPVHQMVHLKDHYLWVVMDHFRNIIVPMDYPN